MVNILIPLAPWFPHEHQLALIPSRPSVVVDSFVQKRQHAQALSVLVSKVKD